MTMLIRKAALTAATAALVGGAIAGPATAIAAPAATAAAPTTAVTTDRGHDRDARKGGKELRVRYEAQSTFYFCGPAAARNALSTLDKNISQDDLARDMGTTENGTDSAHIITKALNAKAGKDTYRTVEISTPKADDKQTDRLRGDIVKAVDDGRAIVANIAGTATDTDGNAHSFEGGHYISVVGYRDNGDTVKIADSADPNQASYWITTEALADWTASRGYSA